MHTSLFCTGIKENVFNEFSPKTITEQAKNDSEFSDKDKEVAKNYNMVLYLVTPMGQVKKYDSTKLIFKEKTIYKSAPKDPVLMR